MSARTLSLRGRRYALGAQFTAGAFKYFAWWILAATVIATAAGLIVAAYGSQAAHSGWFYAANAAKFFTAFIGAAFVVTLMPILVAQGLTRRESAVSFGVFALLWSAGVSVLCSAGFLAEHAYYRALGWTQTVNVDGADHAIDSVGSAFGATATYPLSYLIYFLGGAIIGLCCYRWESTGWLSVVPVIPIGLAVDNGLAVSGPWGPGWLLALIGVTDDLPAAGGITLAVAAILLGAWLFRGILLDTPIRPKKA
ncbi:hypothetical protein [Glycomyces buryatensis]|uniref:Uncharacterized protein n=1 Tax=Glycomyces buryatensis TaxID=2570927 RepID=A0A4S8Q5D2_9ACTN|nr:hypothetical protein [Glycomyces buryatensis]THV38441.1 hypothetical protein FAB82_18495 [Glycomyces buryatensis]